MSRSAIEHLSISLKVAWRRADEDGLADPGVVLRIEAMDLEERTLETVGEHCEECGAKLTDAELKQAIEIGGPALCTVHAAEATPLDPDVLDEPAA
jgi:hypothetical protein